MCREVWAATFAMFAAFGDPLKAGNELNDAF